MLSYDVFKWGEGLKKAERPTPEPLGTEVLLRLRYCGVCHSDVHIRDGYFNLGGGKRLLMSDRGMRPPVTLGHEPYGTIIAAGSEAADVPMGADRLVYPWTGCGACGNCRKGLDNFCPAPHCIGIQRAGGYADHLLVPHPRYLVDAGGIDPPWAATLSCSGLSSYAAVSKLKPIPPEEWVAVIGAGGLGLAAIGILRALGHERIIAVDIDGSKLDAAAAAGAAASLEGPHSDSSEKLQRISGGSIYGAVDLVGNGNSTTFALSVLRKGGRLVLVGLYGGKISISVVATIQRALTIRGSHLGTVTELKEVVALAREGKIRRIPIQTRPLSEVSRTLDELKKGAILGRVVAEI